MASCNEVTNSLSCSNCCIVLIYGIPGSGKTYLSQQLVKNNSEVGRGEGESNESLVIKWLHVCMDHYYPPDTRNHTQVSTDTSSFNWKQSRQLVTTHIEDYLSHKPNPISTSVMEGQSVLVIDDNLPLTSMRYEYYQLARKYSCGFVSVYLYCQLEVALQRNSQRPVSIPSQTITDMYQMIETPKENWELKNTLSIDTSRDGDHYWLMDTCSQITSMCQTALNNPLQPLTVVDITKIKESQKQTSESILHQSDQILRQFVSNEITSCQSKEEKKERAIKANKVRRIILNELQQKCELVVDMSKLSERLKLKYDHVLSTI